MLVAVRDGRSTGTGLVQRSTLQDIARSELAQTGQVRRCEVHFSERTFNTHYYRMPIQQRTLAPLTDA